jgi:hypothetical protein
VTDDPFDRALERERAERRQRRHRAARARFRLHATTFATVNLLLVVIWAVTWWWQDVQHPWFLYPLLGWGIGLALHLVAIRTTRPTTTRREGSS